MYCYSNTPATVGRILFDGLTQAESNSIIKRWMLSLERDSLCSPKIKLDDEEYVVIDSVGNGQCCLFFKQANSMIPVSITETEGGVAIKFVEKDSDFITVLTNELERFKESCEP